jgi:uncharacterized protein YprB with RNaseH-like and TPR domain
MILNTFCILNGIGEKLEKRLWRTGVLTWDDFIKSAGIGFISPAKKEQFDKYLASASRAIENADARFFASTIKRREHWRLFDIFRGEAACLDIETNGLMPERGGFATVVGIYDGFDYKCFLRDEDLTGDNLKKELSRYKYLITFFGAAFDVPFLMRSMPDLKFDIPHFDICFSSKRIGFNGGLKKLETDLGIKRDNAVRKLNGYDAIKLWEFSRKGSSQALELLKIYNKEDTVNLFRIANIVYHRLRSQTGIEEYLCTQPSGAWERKY